MRRVIACFFLLCAGCAPASVEDFRLQGETETRKLLIELRAIETKEDLGRALPRIKKRFNKIADVLIGIHECPERGSKYSSPLGEELFAELARLYEIPGARNLIESAQFEAVRRLDTHRVF